MAGVLAWSGALPRVPHAPVQVAVIGVLLLAGVVAARSPRSRRLGALFAAEAFLWALALLGSSPDSVPYSFGRIIGWFVSLVLAYLILSFPTGRLAGRPERTLFRLLALVVVLLYVGSALFTARYPASTPWVRCTGHCPANAFLVVDHADAAGVVRTLREALTVVLIGGVTVVLLSRLATATRVRRRALAPVAGMSCATVVVLAAFLVTRGAAPHAHAVNALAVMWSLCIGGIAVAFLVGWVRRRLLIAEALAQLSASLTGELSASRLRATLAAALGDDSLQLLLWDERVQMWRDSDGRPVARHPGPDRACVEIQHEGAPVAQLRADGALDQDDELLDAVAAHARAALVHAHITAELERAIDELADSRRSIAAAAIDERQRIERDLHDGAQQRLVALRIKLSLADELVAGDPSAATAQLRELGQDVELALDEVRAIAHGVYPSLLAHRGIEDALREALRGSALPVRLLVRNLTRHPAEVESAVYFTCLEAVQNAAKHAGGATGVWIWLRENGALDFEVRDDGSGFVASRGGRNGGLRNMRDRVEAVGGRFAVHSSPGRGTRVLGRIPLDGRDR